MENEEKVESPLREEQEQLLKTLIEGLLSAVDQRYAQHIQGSVLPLASRIDALAQGFTQLFLLVKRNRRDSVALEMAKLIADREHGPDSPTDIAKMAYDIADAMEARAELSEKPSADAIREMAMNLSKAKRGDGAIAESPSEMAERLARPSASSS